jgi:hypothetical protein
MGPGKDLDPFNQLRVAGDRAMVVPVRANEISQHLGVTAVRFGPRDSVAVPIPGRGHRVDGVDLVARTHQCGHEQAPVYLDADHHLRGLIDVVTDELMQLSNAFHRIGHPTTAHHRARLIHHTDVVMVLRPIHSNEDH